MFVVLVGLWALLFLKLAWNTMVPVVLHKRHHEALGHQRGISVMFAVEWVLAIVLLGFSAFRHGDHWYDATGSVAVVAVGGIIASYGLMVVTATVAKVIFDRRRRQRP